MTNRNINRRIFLKTLGMASPILALPGFDAHIFDNAGYYYCLPQSKIFNDKISLTSGVYSTFGWKYLGMGTKSPLELKFKRPTKKVKNLVFRFTSSIWQKERFHVELYLLKSHKIINSTEVWNPYFLQPFEIEIGSSFVDPVFDEGIGVRPVGHKESFFIFSDTDENIPVQFRPSLLCHKDTTPQKNEVVKRLADDSSLQFFGWPEGCLWDGIFDLGESCAKFDSPFIIQRRLKHLSVFLCRFITCLIMALCSTANRRKQENTRKYNVGFRVVTMEVTTGGSEEEFDVITRYGIAFLEKYINGSKVAGNTLQSRDPMLTRNTVEEE